MTRSSTSEGVAAEVLFPDADVLGTGRAAPSPFGSGLGIGRTVSTPSGYSPALGRTIGGWPTSVATNPHRRIGCAVVPVTEGVDAAVEQIHWAAEHGLRGS